MTATDLLNAALRLSTQERAEMASVLLHSLDETVDPEAEETWAIEIQRRIREVEGGAVELLDWEQVRAELVAKLGR